MALKDIFKFSRKTFFNPSGWLGANELSLYNRIIGKNLKSTFTTPRPQQIETFEQALQRLQVTEADLQNTAYSYQMYSLFFIALSICSFLAGFYYLFVHHTFSGWILATMVSILFAAQAFRFNFWYFQIKQRKLGCTFREWWSGKVGINKDPMP